MNFKITNHNEINNEFLIDSKFKCVDETFIPHINNSSYNFLMESKKLINSEKENWDIVRKITNPFEYIHTPYYKNISVSKYKPISRAYYKLIEIIQKFKILDNYKDTYLNSFHLAEGPGGFIEAISNVRDNMLDSYHGMTLIDNNNNIIPRWDKIEFLLKKRKNIIIEYGNSNDGDLYKLSNLQFIQQHFKYKMDIITADGGFDFSIDFNKQEIYAIKLLYSQLIYALNMQKIGGTFIMKIFDIFSKAMIDIIYLLSTIYHEVNIYKPNTSRIANSEKYIICQNFKGINPILLIRLENIYHQLISYDIENDKLYLYSILNIEHNLSFKNQLKELNTLFAQQQIENIYLTIGYIQKNFNKKKFSNKIIELQKKNIQMSLLWCKMHNIDFNDNNKKNMFLDY